MKEYDYIVISALQRLRAARDLLGLAGPVDGVHDEADRGRYDSSLRAIDAMIGHLEGEVSRLRDEEEDDDD